MDTNQNIVSPEPRPGHSPLSRGYPGGASRLHQANANARHGLAKVAGGTPDQSPDYRRSHDAAVCDAGSTTGGDSAAIADPGRHDATGGASPVAAASPLQRGFEIVFALIVLLVTLPLMLLIALIIRLDSPGPVLFRQQRLGKDARNFTFIKFRTLYADARERFPELYAYRYSPEQLADLKFKVDADPRVTRCGTWLRRTSLDELPNFWNVLTGDMALVGPRPEIPEMLQYYHGDMLLKFSVRPGVTGPAQISGRGRLTFFDTVAFDVDYARKRSFAYDIKVVLTTIRKVVLQDGAF